MAGQICWWICQKKSIVVCLFIDNLKEVVEKTCENILMEGSEENTLQPTWHWWLMLTHKTSLV